MDDHSHPRGGEPTQDRNPWNKVPVMIAWAQGGIEKLIAVTFGSALALSIMLFAIAIGTSVFYLILRIVLRYAFDIEIENPFDGWQYAVPTSN